MNEPHIDACISYLAIIDIGGGEELSLGYLRIVVVWGNLAEVSCLMLCRRYRVTGATMLDSYNTSWCHARLIIVTSCQMNSQGGHTYCPDKRESIIINIIISQA